MKTTFLSTLLILGTVHAICQGISPESYTISPNIDGKPHFISGKISIGTSTIGNKLLIEDNTTTTSENIFGVFKNYSDISYVSQEYISGSSGGKLELGFAASGYSLTGYNNRGTLIARNSSGLILRSTPASGYSYDGITFQTGNSGILEKMRLDGDGNLGIGITTPQQKLHVVGNGLLSRLSLNTSTVANKLYIEDNTTTTSENIFGVFKNNSDISYVSQEYISGSSGGKLELGFASSGYSLTGYNNRGTLIARNSSGLILRSTPASGYPYDGITFQTGSSGILEKMRLDGNGNLGIGTNTPQQKLHVVGNGLLSNLSLNTNTIANKLYIEDNSIGGGSPDSRVFAAFRNTNNASTVSQQFIVGDDGFLEIGYLGSQYGGVGSSLNNIYGDFSTVQARGGSKGLILRADASSNDAQEGTIKFLAGFGNLGGPERMRITSNGFIGIGTQDPNFKLHVEDGTLQVANGNIRVQAGDIYVTEATKGIILKSPNGTCWRVTIDDNGDFNKNVTACPLN